MTKILPWRLKQSFGPFNMLTVHKCSDTGFFGIKVTPLCSVYNFRNKKSSEVHLIFRSIWNFMEIPEMQKKNSENIFWFCDNSIWIGCVKHSLLQRENTCRGLSIYQQTVSRFQILLQPHFWSWFCFKVIKKYDKHTPMQSYVVFRSL